MKRLPVLLILGFGVLFVGIVVGALRYADAQTELARQQAAMESTLAHATELMELRAKHAVPGSVDSSADLDTLLDDALIASGLDGTYLESLRPGPPARNGAETVSVQLRALGVDQLGALLIMWDTVEQPWRISRIECRHAPAGSAALNRYEVSMLFLSERNPVR
jgi:hypothetical protein